MKRISILGSTGSIGRQALQIVRNHPETFSLAAIAAKNNIDLLEQQVREFHPEVIAVLDKDKAHELQRRLGKEVLAGEEGIKAVATYEKMDLCLIAIASFSALAPTLAAIEAGKAVAMASKEVLVGAGKLVVEKAKEKGVSFIPVDSEHTALFQCLKGEETASVSRMLLTASGGPFRTHTLKMLENIQLADALAHPNYKMGPKVTIDSSTLMNKGLEMIEAHHLYGIAPEKIEVIIHPEQFIHSMVEFIDGSIMAQLSDPNMLLPIQYALTYPERKTGPLPPFDFTKAQTWSFMPPDTGRFPCLDLAYESARQGGSMPCYLTAANETIVSRFLQGEISWIDIGKKLENLLSTHRGINNPDISTLLKVDQEAREKAACI